MGNCFLNFFLVRVKLLIWWDFCLFFKVLLEQLLKFVLIEMENFHDKVTFLHGDSGTGWA